MVGSFLDVFKHLILTSILEATRPDNYWESHAGAATYSLEKNPVSEHGVFRFLEIAKQNRQLQSSALYRLLTDLTSDSNNEKMRYPGSAYIALFTLGVDTNNYLFCDIDAGSLKSIRETVNASGVPIRHVAVLLEDGPASLRDAANRMTISNAKSTFVFIDPTRPFEKTPSGIHSLDLFLELAERGIRCAMWYQFDSINHSQTFNCAFRATSKLNGIDTESNKIQQIEIRSNKTQEGGGLIIANIPKSVHKTVHETTAIFEQALKSSGVASVNKLNFADE